MHDVLEGLVIADFQRSIDIHEVIFKVKCLVWVDIVHGNNYHDTASDKIFHFNHQVFPPADLANAVSSKSLTLPAGHYEWPFTVDLSQFSGMVVPPTSSGKGGSFVEQTCSYKVTFSYKAVVHRDSKWKVNIRDTRFLNLLPCVDVDYLENAPMRTVQNELEYKMRDGATQSSSFFSRTPKVMNKIVARVDMPVIIPQAPRLMGLSLHLNAEKEVCVDSIQVKINQRVFIEALYNKSSVRSSIICGESNPSLVGTKLDLTRFIGESICHKALPTYQVKRLNCCHQLDITIHLSDPAAPSKKTKMHVTAPVFIASSNVHRHNAPMYDGIMKNEPLPEKMPLSPQDKA